MRPFDGSVESLITPNPGFLLQDARVSGSPPVKCSENIDVQARFAFILNEPNGQRLDNLEELLRWEPKQGPHWVHLDQASRQRRRVAQETSKQGVAGERGYGAW
jgi:hypothetical protein